MSYTRTYNSSITVTGTVDYSYPASEYGGSGSVSYTRTVPVTININVDTDPFDRSVAGTTSKVDMLTGAVSAMEIAQAAVIKETSEQISDKIIGGFFNLINSQVSMQKAEESSEVQSRIALVLEFSKAIVEMHERMESDFNRLKTHYQKIFDNIQEDYQNRVRQLDRPIFRLGSDVRESLILKPYKSEGATGFYGAYEEGRTKGLMTTAWLRKKIVNVVEKLTDFAMRTLQYRQNISSKSQNVAIAEKKTEYVPVAYMVSEGVGQVPEYKCQCFAPEVNGKETIASEIENILRSGQMDTIDKMSVAEYQNVLNAFMERAEREFGNSNVMNEHSKRVYNEIVRLWNQNMNNIVAGGTA